MRTLQRRLKKSVLYARLGAITGSRNVPGRVAAFKAYDLLTQVYTGARMSDMFPNYVNINPADGHVLYPWDSDLFAPIDEDGDPIMRGALPGAPPVAPGMVVPPSLYLALCTYCGKIGMHRRAREHRSM
jgi:hypothetical protein